MITTTRCTQIAGLLALALMSFSCAHFGKDAPNTATAMPSETAACHEGSSLENCEAALRSAIQDQIHDQGTASKQQAKLVHQPPYWYKTYEVYPETDFTVVTQRTESRTAPYIADVLLKKIRYATCPTRNKEEASADSHFLRHSGTQTLTYRFCNGKWSKTGSLFLVEKTEDNIDGEWVAVKPATQVVSTEKDETGEGWFSRTWGRIRGR